MTGKAIEVMIVDDHAIVREGLRTLLSEEAELHIIGEAASGAEAIALAATATPDVVLMDLVMPDMDGVEAMRQLVAMNPAIHVLVLTSFSDEMRIGAAVRAGATGYLLKDVLKPDLLRAIHAAARGEPHCILRRSAS